MTSSFAIILMGKRGLVALLGLVSWCFIVVMWLFLAVPWVCLQFVIVVFPDHTHLLFLHFFYSRCLALPRFSFNMERDCLQIEVRIGWIFIM